jgi:ABC-2 type transport system permease protein
MARKGFVFNVFRGFNAIMRKEFTIVLRDPLTLFFMLFPPLVEMIAFGFALDNDVKYMATVVYNEDKSAESRRLIDMFVNTETFRISREVHSVDEMVAEIRRGKAYVGLQIPPDFSRDLYSGRSAKVQVLIDGSSSTVALQALNTAMGITLTRSLGSMVKESGAMAVPIEVRPQMLFNPSMRSPNFYLPGVIGVVLQIATTFATAMSMVRERERGTLEQLLVSPLSRWGLMLGKIIPYLVIGFIMACALFVFMRYLFQVPIAGNMTVLLVGTVLYIFCLLSLGLLVSTRAQNQMQALQMTMTLILPTVFFSGFIFPRETMPSVFYYLGSALPTTYYINLLRGIILRGASLQDHVNDLSILLVMGIGLFVVCALRFRKKIA